MAEAGRRAGPSKAASSRRTPKGQSSQLVDPLPVGRSLRESLQPQRVRRVDYLPMPSPVLSILKSLAPLIVEAGKVAVGMRTSGAAKMDERVMLMEQQTIRAGEVLKGVAEQLQAIAESLRVQAEATEVLRQRAKSLMILSIAALGVSVVALVVAFVK